MVLIGSVGVECLIWWSEASSYDVEDKGCCGEFGAWGKIGDFEIESQPMDL